MQVSVAGNVVACKTERQWREVGETQCGLLTSDPATPTLNHTEVTDSGAVGMAYKHSAV